MVNSFFYKTCVWIMRLALLNFLWIGFSILGLIILGLFPSTIAMFTVVRKWIMKQTEIPILQTFFQAYKKEWLKSNLFGVTLFAVGTFIYFEYSIINEYSHFLLQFSKYPLLLLLIIFGFLLLYGFPTYVHYDINLLQVFKNTVLISLVNPIYTIIMILSLILLYLLVNILPALLFFFGGSVSAFVIMWCCYQAFLQVQEKQERGKSTVGN